MTTSKSELIRTFVLNAMADDYEHFKQIFKDVGKTCIDCGITVNRSEILHALTTLTANGLVQAYRYSGPPRNAFDEIMGLPPPVEIDDPELYTYFFITKNGLEVLHATERWPFDDDYVLRPDWTPPED